MMATTLTLKNIPDALYLRLKLSAEANRQSLINEVIVCLEGMLLPERLPAEARLARAREVRASLGTSRFKARDIDEFKRQDRA
jgi:plasmid stability protein